MSDKRTIRVRCPNPKCATDIESAPDRLGKNDPCPACGPSTLMATGRCSISESPVPSGVPGGEAVAGLSTSGVASLASNMNVIPIQRKM